MVTYTRKNAWNQGGTFSNTDLLWYAKSVGVMQSRQLNDPTSWWFYAAIHGQYLVDSDEAGTPPPADFPNWAKIPGPPAVPTQPLPSQALIGQYWSQCQHATWFFPPWHRGYLYAIENILRKIIIGLGGPQDWALPYWNYFRHSGNQFRIPPAFTLQKLPDGSPNPLYVLARYGPLGTGKIYVPLNAVSQKCQGDAQYIGGNEQGDSGEYGGGITGFEHFDHQTGDLEQDPHNMVHSKVGGNSVTTPYYGLMADPGTAALDPVFYLHHANIDRMWAAWNKAGRSNPVDPNWLNGPAAAAGRQFFMPKPDGSAWNYTPAMVNDISQLGYTYEDLSLGIPVPLVAKNLMRLSTLALAQEIKPTIPMANDPTTELIGASLAPLALSDTGARTTVKLAPPAWKAVSKSLQLASLNSLPDEVYLVLEGIRGTADANVYTVSVNHHYAGHISLFGLRIASAKEGKHGGSGLTVRLDITKIIDELHLTGGVDVGSLDVLIQPDGPTAQDREVTIDRISIYRKGQV